MSTVFTVFIIGWILNCAWEFWHVRFYTKGGSFQQKMPYPWFLLFATTWDAGYITVVYLALAFLKNDFFWIHSINAFNVIVIVIVGFFVAIHVEHRSIRRGKWEYASNMPIVPLLKVGLTPFLQLALLSILTYLIVGLVIPA